MYICICMYMYMYVYVYVCIYIYIYIYGSFHKPSYKLLHNLAIRCRLCAGSVNKIAFAAPKIVTFLTPAHFCVLWLCAGLCVR